jgi:hypothetical protein
VPAHHRMRAFDRDLIRGGHYGQRSCEPRSQAEHMAAPTKPCDVKILLANPEPSTHGTKRPSGEEPPTSAFGDKADRTSSRPEQPLVTQTGRCSPTLSWRYIEMVAGSFDKLAQELPIRAASLIAHATLIHSHSTLRRRSRSSDSAFDGPMCATCPRSSATVRSESASARSRW